MFLKCKQLFISKYINNYLSICFSVQTIYSVAISKYSLSSIQVPSESKNR